MKKLCPLLLVGLLFSTRAFSQGYVWTWHGDSGLFQGTFQVTAAEMQPGSTFTSALFTNSISIISPDGLSYHATNSYATATGRFNPPLSLTLLLLDETTLSRLSVATVPFQGSAISEDSPLPNGRGFETGFWTVSPAPEPSAISLIAFATIVRLIQKMLGRNNPRISPRHPSDPADSF